MCDCFTKVQESLCDAYKDADGVIDSFYVLSGHGDLLLYPRLRFDYHGLKKDGTPRKNISYASLRPTYCPFCGEKYDQEGQG